MNQFGFTIAKDGQIDYDANDVRIMNFVSEKVPSFDTCIACSSCSATCSSAHFTDFNFCLLHLLIRRGEEKHLKQEMKKCMYCGKCQLTCPRGVDNRAVIAAIHQAIATFAL